MISADSPERNVRFRKDLKVPFDLLSDQDHRVADLHGVPIQHKHPMAVSYSDGFIQPAILAYRGEEEIFHFIQTPSTMNLWGAAGRPSAKEVLAKLAPKLSAEG